MKIRNVSIRKGLLEHIKSCDATCKKYAVFTINLIERVWKELTENKPLFWG